ncbi:hypothetical protein H924_02760 [Corynebacterium callunae DSM 20147]|uniref:Uncharacterized protein n=1 Tax=Corynebacterium callunae DSM 20147 TaxID=1121353 RepID=M1TNX7_9CORY|nr:hypothetical protein H924_02730 [Corynebacterium callunae DSM 20147]AGG66006.1 hypothetical protein H924_02760 [Corynebacterium callunae DSM 20147]
MNAERSSTGASASKEGAGFSQKLVFPFQRGVLSLQGLVFRPFDWVWFIHTGVWMLGPPGSYPRAQCSFFDTQLGGHFLDRAP